jgi:hypothetical protein
MNSLGGKMKDILRHLLRLDENCSYYATRKLFFAVTQRMSHQLSINISDIFCIFLLAIKFKLSCRRKERNRKKGREKIIYVNGKVRKKEQSVE